MLQKYEIEGREIIRALFLSPSSNQKLPCHWTRHILRVEPEFAPS